MLNTSCPTSDAAMRQKPPAASRSLSGGRWTASLAWLRDCAALLASGLLNAIQAIAGDGDRPYGAPFLRYFVSKALR